MLVQVRMHGACDIISPIQKFKRPIRTVGHDLHIEISLETKFFIFLKFFTIFSDILKMVILDGYEVIRLTNFVTSIKNSKKNLKNVKFGFQGDFNMEITFNGSDRSFELLNWRYDAASTVHPCLYKHPSITLYIYIYIYIYI